jgi:hypothetical protein
MEIAGIALVAGITIAVDTSSSDGARLLPGAPRWRTGSGPPAWNRAGPYACGRDREWGFSGP